MRSISTLIAAPLLAGCAVTVGQNSMLPTLKEPAATPLTPLAGYARQEQMLTLPTLGVVHVARLTRPGNRSTLIYSGGSGAFVATAGTRLNHLAELSGADVVTFDYPGRGGTTVPNTTDALIPFGSALVVALKQAGWINSGPIYSYGFSLGGAAASNIARSGGFSGLVLEATAADIQAVARNMVPGALKPFVRIKVSNDLNRYDYAGYAVAARTPILMIAGTGDKTVSAATVKHFADYLKSAGRTVTLIDVPGGHGEALSSEQGRVAVQSFLRTTNM